MVFPSGAKISFAHLQFDNTVLDFQGAQISLIAFDELTHFTKQQFMYMMSRNRSVCGAKNRIVATTNPDPDSFVKDLISWWIDEETGLAIKERSGIIRYFLVINDEFKWGDSKEELAFLYGAKPELVKSFTFISSSVYDNKILLAQDPQYLANLNALGEVQKGRLLDGNWKIRPASGMYFKRNKIKLVNSIPGKLRKIVRAWDLAASVPTPQYPNPDYTAGVMIGRLFDGRYIILDVVHGRWTSSDVRKKVLETAKKDKEKYGRVMVRLPRDPGQAGVEQSQSYVKLLAGYPVKAKRVTGDKITRFEPFSAQCLDDSENVLVLIGDWNDAYFNELESFPPEKSGHDDQVDATSDAYSECLTGKSWAGLIS
jgi:predicted phage terminase large subunit-like protein